MSLIRIIMCHALHGSATADGYIATVFVVIFVVAKLYTAIHAYMGPAAAIAMIDPVLSEVRTRPG